VPMRNRTSAPIAAPKNIDTVAIVRRPRRGFVPPARPESAAKPVSVRVSTVVVRSGTASGRAVAFCRPMAMESVAMITYRPTSAGTMVTKVTASAKDVSKFSITSVAANSRPRWAPCQAASRPPASAPNKKAAIAVSEAGTEKSSASINRKAKEHDVTGHVGDKHVTERQIAHCIDQTSHNGQQYEEGGSGPLRGSRVARRSSTVCMNHPALDALRYLTLSSPAVTRKGLMALMPTEEHRAHAAIWELTFFATLAISVATASGFEI
jgi:hypothetical protein